jgi:hypothetical protein
MKEVDQSCRTVSNGALDLLLDRWRRARTNASLGGHDDTGSQPARKHVEKMDAVLHEDSAAFRAVPEPVLRRQIFVRRVVFKVSVKQLAQDLILDQVLDGVEQGVVPLHQVGHEYPVALPCHGDQGIGLRDRHGQRLFANDVLAGLKGSERLRKVEEWRRCDVDHVDVVASQERFDILDVGNAEPPRGGTGGLSVGTRHSRQFHARYLRKLLKGVEPETPAADYAQPSFS